MILINFKKAQKLKLNNHFFLPTNRIGMEKKNQCFKCISVNLYVITSVVVIDFVIKLKELFLILLDKKVSLLQA